MNSSSKKGLTNSVCWMLSPQLYNAHCSCSLPKMYLELTLNYCWYVGCRHISCTMFIVHVPCQKYNMNQLWITACMSDVATSADSTCSLPIPEPKNGFLLVPVYDMLPHKLKICTEFAECMYRMCSLPNLWHWPTFTPKLFSSSIFFSQIVNPLNLDHIPYIIFQKLSRVHFLKLFLELSWNIPRIWWEYSETVWLV